MVFCGAYIRITEKIPLRFYLTQGNPNYLSILKKDIANACYLCFRDADREQVSFDFVLECVIFIAKFFKTVYKARIMPVEISGTLGSVAGYRFFGKHIFLENSILVNSDYGFILRMVLLKILYIAYLLVSSTL